MPILKNGKHDQEKNAIAHTFNMLRSRLIARAFSQTGSHATAEDLVQDSWLKVERASVSTQIDNPAAFIKTVVSHTVLDHLRKERRRAEIDAEVSDILWESSDEQSPERVTLNRQCLERVSSAFGELPERTQEIFALNRFERLSQRNIAERYQITEEAVYYHIRRALEHLSQARETM